MDRMQTSGHEQRRIVDRLAAARVLVIGVGALGCPAALRLGAAGVGTLVLVDPDRVELSNLHRQILHGSAAIGTLKVASAAARLAERFPRLRVETHAEALRADNGATLFAGIDFVIDATDGVTAKFLVNDTAVRLGKPFSHAGILGFLGQTMTVLPGRTACYRCLFPEPPDPAEVPTCEAAGVLGGIAGVIGSLQAAEALKYLTGQGDLLTDCLLTLDALTAGWRRVRLRRNPRCPVCAEPPVRAPLDAAGSARYGS